MSAKTSMLAILLGVSECPRAPNLNALPQCAASAHALNKYLLSALGLSKDDILNLFDSNEAASDQIGPIEDWLAERSSVSKDLIVYYTGHGGFSRNDQAYFLATRKTREGAEGATSIRYVDL